MLTTFLTNLAWVGAVLGWLLFGIRVYGAMTYTDLKRAQDAMRGRVATFPLAGPGVIAVVSTVFLLSV